MAAHSSLWLAKVILHFDAQDFMSSKSNTEPRKNVEQSALPRRHSSHVLRKDLVDHLITSTCRLRLLVAPAGFGKTTLMADCARESSRKTVWLSLGGRSLSSLQLFNRIGDALQPGKGPWNESSLIALLLSQRSTVWLMLDDYPRVIDEKFEFEFGRLLATDTPYIEWWVSSRHRPSCNLPRLMLQSDLLEVDAEKLAFTEAEIDVLLKQQSSIGSLSAATIYQDTQGWCAAARLRIIQPADLDQLLLEYLRHEVLQEFSTEKQNALIVLANMNVFDLKLCEHFFGALAGTELFQELRIKGAFFTAIAGVPGRWQIARPVSRLLAPLADPEDIRDRHRQACQYFIQQGETRLAIEQAVLAGQADVAASLLERLSEAELIDEEAAAKVLAYRSQLPEELLGSTARLVTLYSFTFAVATRPDEALDCVTALGKFLPAPTEALQQRYLACWQVICGLAAHAKGDSSKASCDFLQALEVLDQRDWPLKLACWTVLIQQQLSWGNFDKADTYIRDALFFARSVGTVGAEGYISLYQALLLESKGELRKALQIIERQLQVLDSLPSNRPAIRGRLIIRQAFIEMKLGEVGKARKLFREGHRFCRLSLDAVGFHGLVGQAWIALLDGDLADAEGLLDKAEQELSCHNIPEGIYRSVIDQCRAAVCIERNELDVAKSLFNAVLTRHEAPNGLVQSFERPDFLHQAKRFLAQIDLLGGALDVATEQLALLAEQSKEKGFQLIECEIGLLQAGVEFVQGNEAQARIFMSQTLQRMDRLEYRFPLKYLQRRFPELYRLGASGEVSGLLSHREIEVLRLVEVGYSNQEIADQLFISVFTVKSHIQRLSAKLEVKRRTQAVAKAKSLGLI